MNAESSDSQQDDELDLRLSVRADDLKSAQALSDHVAASLRAFGEVTANEPRQFGGETSIFFTLPFRLRAETPVDATRPRLLEFLGDGWETKIQTEWVSETEMVETLISEWIEAGYKKKRRRFAFDAVYGATLMGPTTTHRG